MRFNVVSCENFWYVLSLGMEDMLSLAYGAAGNMVLMIITVTAVCLPTEFELSLSLRECIKFLLPLLIWLSQQNLEGQRMEAAFSSGPLGSALIISNVFLFFFLTLIDKYLLGWEGGNFRLNAHSANNAPKQ